MTPENRLFLRLYGFIILVDIVTLVILNLLYGVFITVCILSSFSLLRRGLRSRASRAMLGAILISCVLMTIYWSSSVSLSTHVMRRVFYNPSIEVDRKAIQSAPNAALSPLINTCAEAQHILSDLVVLWRGWTLYQRQPRMMMLPCILLFCTLVLSAFYVVSLAIEWPSPTEVDEIRLFPSSSRAKYFMIGTIAASLATNASVTSLILLKLRNHQRSLRGIQLLASSPAQRILTILIESGFTYCAFQVAALIADLVPGTTLPRYIFGAVLTALCDMSTAMYTPFVILLVQENRSMVESESE